MGMHLVFLMAADSDLDALIKKPKDARAFVKKSWSGDEGRRFEIKSIWPEVDYILRAGKPEEQTVLAFLQTDETVIGKVKRVRHMKVGGEPVQWNEYDTEKDFEFGPPSALHAQRVAEIEQALAPVTDEWVRAEYDIEQLSSEHDRERLTAADYDLRIQYCQESVRELKAFIARAAEARMGLLRYVT